MRLALALLLAVQVSAACRPGSGDADPRPAPAASEPATEPATAGLVPSESDADAAAPCRREPFAPTIPVAEASGAVWVPGGGDVPAHVLVVGDSGHRGEYAEIHPVTGAVLAHGHLPLDDVASDDLEGLARIGDTFYGITSSGWVRHWRRQPGGGYELTRPSYPLEAVSTTDVPLLCRSPRATNCARNWEGLCLRDPPPADGCAGFAVAKTDGELYCLIAQPDGRLAAEPSRRISVTRPDSLSGCHFAPDRDLLWAGSNAFDLNTVYRVRAWDGAAEVERVGPVGIGFAEAIAVAPGGVVYRFSDLGGAPSLVQRWICD
jgi:hypothetical protein